MLAPELSVQNQDIRTVFSRQEQPPSFDAFTSGETARQRLTGIHRYILEQILPQIYPDINVRPVLLMDVGVGDGAVTTFELAETARQLVNSDVRVMGFDRNEDIVAEANELFSPSGRIGFQVAKNFQLPIQGEAVFCFNVLRYYNGNDFDEIVGLLGQGVRENGILVVGNNDVNDPRVLTAFVFQKVRGRMQKQTVIFGSVERLDERFVDTLKGLPRADKDVMAFRRDLPAARMESLRGEVFSLDQGLKDRGYRVFPAYGLVVKTLNDLRRDITGSAPRPEMKIIRDVFPAQQSVQQGI